MAWLHPEEDLGGVPRSGPFRLAPEPETSYLSSTAFAHAAVFLPLVLQHLWVVRGGWMVVCQEVVEMDMLKEDIGRDSSWGAKAHADVNVWMMVVCAGCMLHLSLLIAPRVCHLLVQMAQRFGAVNSTPGQSYISSTRPCS
jgi:hypothetical protein